MVVELPFQVDIPDSDSLGSDSLDSDILDSGILGSDSLDFGILGSDILGSGFLPAHFEGILAFAGLVDILGFVHYFVVGNHCLVVPMEVLWLCCYHSQPSLDRAPLSLVADLDLNPFS